MTLTEGVRVVVQDNGYDEDTPNAPYAFKGLIGTIYEVNRGVADDPLFYITFEDPRVNAWFNEDDGTSWPFYANELAKTND